MLKWPTMTGHATASIRTQSETYCQGSECHKKLTEGYKVTDCYEHNNKRADLRYGLFCPDCIREVAAKDHNRIDEYARTELIKNEAKRRAEESKRQSELIDSRYKVAVKIVDLLDDDYDSGLIILDIVRDLLSIPKPEPVQGWNITEEPDVPDAKPEQTKPTADEVLPI